MCEVGTWFLSYLCEMGVIKQGDDVYRGTVSGTLLKTFCGIPKDSYISISMDTDTTLDITYASPKDVEEFENDNREENENCYYCWCNEPFATNVKKTIQISYI